MNALDELIREAMDYMDDLDLVDDECEQMGLDAPEGIADEDLMDFIEDDEDFEDYSALGELPFPDYDDDEDEDGPEDTKDDILNDPELYDDYEMIDDVMDFGEGEAV